MNSAAEALASESAQGYRSIFFSAPDGLRLHARDYGPRDASALPVVCLPGLARTSGDFHPLAVALASDAKAARRVLALDYRGRGASEYDPDPRNYSFAVELADLRAVLTALEIGQAIFIGTSRGGILIMLLAAAQPTAIAGAVLNDIGPLVEAKGLIRIKAYVGKLPQPRSIEEGAEILKRLLDAQFPKLSEGDWRAAAELTWTMRGDGQLKLNYDPQLARTTDDVDVERPIPAMWTQFDALAAVPVMVIRGMLSDLLSAETVQAMRARRKEMEVIEVADQGHPPLIGTPDVTGRIAAFCGSCDAVARH